MDTTPKSALEAVSRGFAFLNFREPIELESFVADRDLGIDGVCELQHEEDGEPIFIQVRGKLSFEKPYRE